MEYILYIIIIAIIVLVGILWLYKKSSCTSIMYKFSNSLFGYGLNAQKH